MRVQQPYGVAPTGRAAPASAPAGPFSGGPYGATQAAPAAVSSGPVAFGGVYVDGGVAHFVRRPAGFFPQQPQPHPVQMELQRQLPPRGGIFEFNRAGELDPGLVLDPSELRMYLYRHTPQSFRILIRDGMPSFPPFWRRHIANMAVCSTLPSRRAVSRHYFVALPTQGLSHARQSHPARPVPRYI